MRRLLFLPQALLGTFVAPGCAAAFDFGFVSAPDRIGPWILGLAVAMVPFWVVVLFSKPRHFAFRDIFRSCDEVSRITRMAHRPTAVLFVALMAMIFAGKSLRRYA